MDLYLQEDTRNKDNFHIEKNKYFESQGIKVLRSKLPFGDYALINDTSICVDTKQSVMEIAGNLTHEHARFKNEIIKANEFGIGLIILIEEEQQYNLDNLAKLYEIPRYKSDGWGIDKITGKKKKTHLKGQPMAVFSVETLVKIMKTMQERYGVLFMFTTKENCGKDIISILYYNKDHFKKYFNEKLGKQNV